VTSLIAGPWSLRTRGKSTREASVVESADAICSQAPPFGNPGGEVGGSFNTPWETFAAWIVVGGSDKKSPSAYAPRGSEFGCGDDVTRPG
jgi:hypothetical protein